MRYQAPITGFDMFSEGRCWNPRRGTTNQSRSTDVRINFSKNLLLNSNIFEDAFLCVFGILQRLFQSFRWLDSVRDNVCVPDRSLELIQALADQGGSPSHGGPVAIEEGYLEARASENNGPSATDQADADYCDFSRHFRSMFSLHASQILKDL
jgi:hypothetical protein